MAKKSSRRQTNKPSNSTSTNHTLSNNQSQDIFTRFTSRTSEILGRAWIFVIALAFLVLWASSGPLLGFSDTWQLIVNTTTTIITFLMVFIIQNTQNRDNLAINLKLDSIMKALNIDDGELLRAEDEADKKLEAQKKKAQNSSRRSSRKR
jgi:low affinity Fe/Cu permease